MLVESFSNRLKEAMNIRGFKQIDLVEKSNGYFDKSQVSRYLSGYYKAKQDKLYVLAQILDVNESWLMGLDVPMERAEIKYDNAKEISLLPSYFKIPVLGRIPAGMPFEAIEDTYTVDHVEIPTSWVRSGKKFFALKLDGDSMEPDFHDNDIVVFEKRKDCENGQCACVKVNGYDATFKKVLKQENGIMLVPLNTDNSSGYKATFYTLEDIEKLPIEIIGVVKRGIRDY